MKNMVYLSLGSNLGNREEYIRQAVQELEAHPDMEVRMVSSLYETDPVGYTDQPPFLNAAVRVQTSLSAEELLSITQKIENKLERIREIRWGPRTIDLDILLYNSERIHSDTLHIPHPRMLERAFVLIPLLEIAPDLTFPGTEEVPLGILFKQLQNKEGVHRWKKKSGAEESGLFES
ncbi:2-amino-4-hydroxy-6-hydroxymethyldihydropteridine diphosphokinase [Fictibacillus fluitans]|uniref:2-amino-4-hydroxy-6-hydroxymethyldihydropteridine diphosphokinase n=1 Tax=Fictibacillus fluitans TaxID=3058422 RepID=A0ABT8I370_9BACL|nr:2-amino-4-hydroxy-6-hydroxymethyldihydropteridine diphosphokinase [Fictibacillus sp. NE201]MDN4527473.1 2-amino-4-hydroxy-6-hydroxymethyldihydropteridine diphosphokinase [Fictibacillus sp. NE201]